MLKFLAVKLEDDPFTGAATDLCGKVRAYAERATQAAREETGTEARA